MTSCCTSSKKLGLHEQQKAEYDECLVADTKATIDLVINDLLTDDNDMDTADKIVQ